MTGEEKLEKVFQYINRKADFGNTLSVGNARRAAQFAYDAGRESVVDKASELEWVDIGLYGGYARYVNVCRAHKPLEEYLIREWFCPKDIELHCNNFTKNGFKNIEEAKAYAKEAYKRRIEQALGL